MCQFCSEHGEGKTWYLNAGNYASELLADLERHIDIEKCYGCGVCRAVCPGDAIQLHERRLDSVASRLWE